MNNTTLPITIEEIPLGSSRIKVFADLPWQLFKNDLCWTPPLRGDLLGNRLLGLVGILTPKHPYHRHAQVIHYIAWQGNKAVGRISAAINHRFNTHYKSKIGFFGFFEVTENYAVAKELLNRAQTWIKRSGMETMRGPGEYSNATHERQGILIDGFQFPPTVELTHNPPYYAAFVEKYGLCKVKDYHAYIVDRNTETPPRLKRLAEQVRQRRKVQTRPLVLKELDSEVRLIVKIYNEAWAHNWGFLPITEDEADSLADSLRLVVDEGLIRFAFVNDEPAAVLGAFPDPYHSFRPRWNKWGDSDFARVARLIRLRRNTPSTRLMFFGIRPKFQRLGIDALLFDEFRDYFIAHGYHSCEASLLLEDNHLILSPSEFMGAHRYKTWRIYEMPV